jgi:hypothetical protein
MIVGQVRPAVKDLADQPRARNSALLGGNGSGTGVGYAKRTRISSGMSISRHVARSARPRTGIRALATLPGRGGSFCGYRCDSNAEAPEPCLRFGSWPRVDARSSW